jgi:hypothetical protein
MTTPPDDAASTPGEQMARRLVQDVQAYEVDPPAPARAGQDTGRDADGDTSGDTAPGTRDDADAGTSADT